MSKEITPKQTGSIPDQKNNTQAFMEAFYEFSETDEGMEIMKWLVNEDEKKAKSEIEQMRGEWEYDEEFWGYCDLQGHEFIPKPLWMNAFIHAALPRYTAPSGYDFPDDILDPYDKYSSTNSTVMCYHKEIMPLVIAVSGTGLVIEFKKSKCPVLEAVSDYTFYAENTRMGYSYLYFRIDRVYCSPKIEGGFFIGKNGSGGFNVFKERGYVRAPDMSSEDWLFNNLPVAYTTSSMLYDLINRAGIHRGCYTALPLA